MARGSTCAPRWSTTTGWPAASSKAEDFYEGVRAFLIDRDRTPSWQPGRLEDVTEAMVERLLRALWAQASCSSPSRAELQGFQR